MGRGDVTPSLQTIQNDIKLKELEKEQLIKTKETEQVMDLISVLEIAKAIQDIQYI